MNALRGIGNHLQGYCLFSIYQLLQNLCQVKNELLNFIIIT